MYFTCKKNNTILINHNSTGSLIKVGVFWYVNTFDEVVKNVIPYFGGFIYSVQWVSFRILQFMLYIFESKLSLNLFHNVTSDVTSVELWLISTKCNVKMGIFGIFIRKWENLEIIMKLISMNFQWFNRFNISVNHWILLNFK